MPIRSLNDAREFRKNSKLPSPVKQSIQNGFGLKRISAIKSEEVPDFHTEISQWYVHEELTKRSVLSS